MHTRQAPVHLIACMQEARLHEATRDIFMQARMEFLPFANEVCYHVKLSKYGVQSMTVQSVKCVCEWLCGNDLL